MVLSEKVTEASFNLISSFNVAVFPPKIALLQCQSLWGLQRSARWTSACPSVADRSLTITVASCPGAVVAGFGFPRLQFSDCCCLFLFLDAWCHKKKKKKHPTLIWHLYHIATNKAAKWPTAVPVILLPMDIFKDTWWYYHQFLSRQIWVT